MPANHYSFILVCQAESSAIHFPAELFPSWLKPSPSLPCSPQPLCNILRAKVEFGRADVKQSGDNCKSCVLSLSQGPFLSWIWRGGRFWQTPPQNMDCGEMPLPWTQPEVCQLLKELLLQRQTQKLAMLSGLSNSGVFCSWAKEMFILYRNPKEGRFLWILTLQFCLI